MRDSATAPVACQPEARLELEEATVTSDVPSPVLQLTAATARGTARKRTDIALGMRLLGIM
jgi:hypothetical protein